MKGSENFTYSNTNSDYVIKIKGRNYWWLLLFLLLLLPLLLLIKFKKDVVFKTTDSVNKTALSDASVKFTYTYREFFNFSSFSFSTSAPLTFQDTTGNDGIVVFKDVSYTLFSKLFYRGEIAEVTATGGCFMGDSIKPVFHDLKHKEENILELPVRAYDLDFQVIDNGDGQPIPNADVEAIVYMNGSPVKWNKTTDAHGMIVLEKIPYCADKISITGRKNGYSPDSINNMVKNITGELKQRTLLLDPARDMVKITVKDLYTKQPVPNAVASLIAENDTINTSTNTNGVGKGVFENIRITAQIKIKVSHTFYFDTITPQYKAEAFNKLSEEERTIYIRPRTQNVAFRDIDGSNGNPLPGTNNEIYINGKLVTTQISNSNGVFMVSDLRKTDKISIIAKRAEYKTNDYTIKNKTADELTSESSRDIPLNTVPPPPPPPEDNRPVVGCRAHFTGTLVSDVSVDGHISQIYVADKYSEYVGEGEYPSNKRAFPNAVRTTFDGIAIDKGTRVIIYSDENFKGQVLLDQAGPALINNVKWKGDSRLGDFMNKTFAAPYQDLFPPSTRHWSINNMNDWSNGSVKIICEKK